MKRIRFLVMAVQVIAIAFLNPLLVWVPKIQAETVVRVGYPCKLGSSYTISDSLNNTISHHNGNNRSNDLFINSQCADSRAIAAIDGTIKKIKNPLNWSIHCGEPSVPYDTTTGNFIDQYLILSGTDSDGNKIDVFYVHMDMDAATTIADGSTVKAGDYLGEISDKGCAVGKHIHFDVQKNGSYLNYDQWEYKELNKLSLISPANNSMIPFSQQYLTLSWEPLSNYSGYYYLVINGESYNPIIIPNNQTSYNLKISDYLVDQNITWQIRSSKSVDGITIVSEVRNFKKVIPTGNYMSPYQVVSVTAGSKVVQSKVRKSDNHVMTRIYDANTNIWSDWENNGASVYPIQLVSAYNKVFQSRVDINNIVATRIYDTNTNTWTDWNWSSNVLSNQPATMASSVKFYGCAPEVNCASPSFTVVQSIVNPTSKHVQTRIFDSLANSWSTWEDNGASIFPVAMHGNESFIIQARVDPNNIVATRIYSTSNKTWGEWDWSSTILANQPVSLASKGNKIVESTVSKSNNHILTRIYDGKLWSAWEDNGASITPVSLESTSDGIVQSAINPQNIIATRIYDTQSNTWSAWNWDANIKGVRGVTISSAQGGILMTTSLPNSDYVISRYFNSTTKSWGDWSQSGRSKEIIDLIAINTKTFQSTIDIDDKQRIRSFENGVWGNWQLTGGD